ncbi:MAG TPA: FeoA family protein [Gammaproteobacteria bacterium]
MSEPTLTLADLEPGDRAEIVAVDTADKAVQRLMVLGLVEGAELTFLRRSIGGDPLELSIYGAAISLRRDQARHFRVERRSGRRLAGVRVDTGTGHVERR